MTDPVLELRGFSFRIGDRWVLKDVSLSVSRGEHVAIVGPNGAGKTSLLKCINRIWKGGVGTIVLEGRALEGYGQRELARRLAYVPQADGRVAPFTARQFVGMGRYPHLRPLTAAGPGDERAVDKALEEAGASGFAGRSLDALSGGERQKVFIAAALAQEAGILLLDEPTTFLDPRHQAEIHRLLGRLHGERGVTLLCATHDVNGALAHADRIVALREGGIVFDGPAPDLAREEILRKVYDHAFIVSSHPRTGRPVILPEEN